MAYRLSSGGNLDREGDTCTKKGGQGGGQRDSKWQLTPFTVYHESAVLGREEDGTRQNDMGTN